MKYFSMSEEEGFIASGREELTVVIDIVSGQTQMWVLAKKWK
jgi:hypothetical protein